MADNFSFKDALLATRSRRAIDDGSGNLIGVDTLFGDDKNPIMGSKSDAAWDGVAATPTWTAIWKFIATLLNGVLKFERPPVTFTTVSGSPFTLTSAWVKVVTTTSATKALHVSPIATASVYDIEWVAVTAGAGVPTDTFGEPILGGEDFSSGLPIGDIYLKSATGQVAIVRTGV